MEKEDIVEVTVGRTDQGDFDLSIKFKDGVSTRRAGYESVDLALDKVVEEIDKLPGRLHITGISSAAMQEFSEKLIQALEPYEVDDELIEIISGHGKDLSNHELMECLEEFLSDKD